MTAPSPDAPVQIHNFRTFPFGGGGVSSNSCRSMSRSSGGWEVVVVLVVLVVLVGAVIVVIVIVSCSRCSGISSSSRSSSSGGGRCWLCWWEQ